MNVHEKWQQWYTAWRAQRRARREEMAYQKRLFTAMMDVLRDPEALTRDMREYGSAYMRMLRAVRGLEEQDNDHEPFRPTSPLSVAERTTETGTDAFTP